MNYVKSYSRIVNEDNESLASGQANKQLPALMQKSKFDSCNLIRLEMNKGP